MELKWFLNYFSKYFYIYFQSQEKKDFVNLIFSF